MTYVIIGFSIFFIAVGFILTESNAKYILAGYNTMKEEDRKKVNLKTYIPHFRKFHIFLGTSFLIFGISIHYFIGELASSIFLAIYPILAYIYFIIDSSKHSKGLSKGWNKIGAIILILTLIPISGLIMYEYKDSTLIVNSEGIEIKGGYGEILKQSDIENIDLVSRLPKITIKSNGFALGNIKKGYFRTKEGEKIKLILNNLNMPCILITKADGEKIYFSDGKKSNEEVYLEIQEVLYP